MKERIYMIPVNDAYRSSALCPLCELRNAVENSSLEYYLGPSLMEPDVRISTNTKGFCGDHLQKMYGREINRLGMGLMLHTHLVDLAEDINPCIASAAPSPGTLFRGRDRDYKKNLEAAADRIEARAESCIICDKIADTMERYLDVLLWMYFEDPSFRELFRTKKTHCLGHTAFLLRGASKYLNQNQAAEFVSALASDSAQGLAELTGDIEWFTQKFDYRNKDKPWGGAKSAIPRAISFLSERGGPNDEAITNGT